MRTLSTQKKIAQKLGVSTATVSRTLNDLPGVSDDVRARILKAANELEYSPNLPARSLATSVTQTVAFVVHETNHIASEDPFYPVIMAGAQAFLAERNYHILLTTLDDRTMERPQAFSVVSQKRVDGLILAGPEISTPFVLAMQSAGIPVVLVDNCLSQTPINCVLNDDEGSAHQVTRHLLDHGHNRIVFLSGPQEWTSNRERARGYELALHEAGLEPYIIYGSRTTIETGQVMLREALDRWPDLTAVFGVNDSVAIGALRSASELGRRTPDDLAVFGFDDISWAALNQPPLSTVHVYKRRIGQLAAQCLLDSIVQPEAAPARTAVAAKLVLRASCGHAA
jgi:LacI family transcriptional regulator